MSSFTKLLRESGLAVDSLANAAGVDRGTRASALAALSGRIDQHVSRLARETEAANAKRNPVDQKGGD